MGHTHLYSNIKCNLFDTQTLLIVYDFTLTCHGLVSARRVPSALVWIVFKWSSPTFELGTPLISVVAIYVESWLQCFSRFPTSFPETKTETKIPIQLNVNGISDNLTITYWVPFMYTQNAYAEAPCLRRSLAHSCHTHWLNATSLHTEVPRE